MINIRLFTQALKLYWVKKYLDTGNHAKWKLFFNLQLRDLLGGGTIFKGNLHKKDLLAYFKVSDVFLQEILQTWSNINYVDNISSKEQFFFFFVVYIIFFCNHLTYNTRYSTYNTLLAVTYLQYTPQYSQYITYNNLLSYFQYTLHYLQ